MIAKGLGKWVRDLELPPGTYENRFIIDGKWLTDPRCAHTVPNAFRETNSLLIMTEPRHSGAVQKRKCVIAAVLA